MLPSTVASANKDPINDEKVAASDGVKEVLELSPTERARLLRKLDWHLLPLVSFLYLLSFL